MRRPRLAQAIRNVLTPAFWWLVRLRRPRAAAAARAIIAWRMRSGV